MGTLAQYPLRLLRLIKVGAITLLGPIRADVGAKAISCKSLGPV